MVLLLCLGVVLATALGACTRSVPRRVEQKRSLVWLRGGVPIVGQGFRAPVLRNVQCPVPARAASDPAVAAAPHGAAPGGSGTGAPHGDATPRHRHPRRADAYAAAAACGYARRLTSGPPVSAMLDSLASLADDAPLPERHHWRNDAATDKMRDAMCDAGKTSGALRVSRRDAQTARAHQAARQARWGGGGPPAAPCVCGQFLPPSSSARGARAQRAFGGDPACAVALRPAECWGPLRSAGPLLPGRHDASQKGASSFMKVADFRPRGTSARVVGHVVEFVRSRRSHKISFPCCVDGILRWTPPGPRGRNPGPRWAHRVCARRRVCSTTTRPSMIRPPNFMAFAPPM